MKHMGKIQVLLAYSIYNLHLSPIYFNINSPPYNFKPNSIKLGYRRIDCNKKKFENEKKKRKDEALEIVKYL